MTANGVERKDQVEFPTSTGETVLVSVTELPLPFAFTHPGRALTLMWAVLDGEIGAIEMNGQRRAVERAESRFEDAIGYVYDGATWLQMEKPGAVLVVRLQMKDGSEIKIKLAAPGVATGRE